MTVELLNRHENHRLYCFLSCHNLLVAFWDRDVPGPAISRLGALLSNVRHAHPEGFGVLVWVAPLTPGLQTKEEQQAISRIMRENSEGYRALAYVFPGEGFMSAIVRASITAINVIAKPKHQVRVFSSARAAFVWLRQCCSPDLHVDDVTAATERELRRWDDERRT